MSKLTLYRLNQADLSDEGVSAVLSDDYPRAEIRLQPKLAARLFVTRSEPTTPEWLEYLSPLCEEPLEVVPRETLGAVLLLRPDARQRFLYAATWGSGHFLLRHERVQPDLGLRCALNLLSATGAGSAQWDPARLRSLRAKRIGPNTLIVQSQYARQAPLESFPFSIDADQLRAVTGSPVQTETWGTSVTGGVSLHLKRPDSPLRLAALCREVDRVFRSQHYKSYFGWLDNVAQVTDPEIRGHVEAEVVHKLIDGDLELLGLAPPTIVPWERIDSFELQLGRSHRPLDDPSLPPLRAFLADGGKLEGLDFGTLRRVKLNALDADGETVQSWDVARCLTGEVRVGRRSYVIDEGTVFAVAADYLEELNRFVDGVLPEFAVRLPDAVATMHEGPYNEALAMHLPEAILLDKVTVTGKGVTPIEICDVASSDNKLIHVKRGTSSGSLSHLFSQAAVSAELLHMDPEFRQRVSTRLEDGVTGSGAKRLAAFAWLHAAEFRPTTCEVVMAVMTGRARQRTSSLLPFFSKVNLRMRCDDLRRMGYRYSFAQITAP